MVKILRHVFYNPYFTAAQLAADTDLWSGHYPELTQVAAVKALNPSYAALVYLNARTVWNSSHPEWDQAKYNLFLGNGWLLKDSSGNLVTDESGHGFLVDLGNSACQQWLANWLLTYINSGSLAGCVIDNFAPSLEIEYDVNTPATNPRTGVAWTDNDWALALTAFATVIKNTIGTKLLYVNMCANGNHFYNIPSYSTGYQYIYAHAPIDGVCCECPWGDYSVTYAFYAEAIWLLTVNYFTWLEANFLSSSKALWVISTNAGLVDTAPDGQGNYPTALPSGVTREQYAMYCLASLMLTTSSGKIYYESFGNYIIAAYAQTLLGLDLGAPSGAYSLISSTHVYTRTFANGIVYVNPSASSYTVTVSGNYKYLDGSTVPSSVTIPPDTGLIILSVNTPTYTLTVQAPSSGGYISPPAGTYTETGGSSVGLQASPLAGYVFDHWVLDGSSAGNTNPYSLTMNANHTMTAVFTATTPGQQGTTLDNQSLTVTKWAEDVSTTASQWDAWKGGASYKRQVKVYGIVRTYVIDCIENAVAWANSLVKYFETTATNGTPVVFYSDQAVRPVSSVSVFVLKVAWTLENIAGKNVRKFTLTLQEAQ